MLNQPERRWWLMVEVPLAAPGCDVEPDPSEVDGGIGRDKPAGYLIDTGVGLWKGRKLGRKSTWVSSSTRPAISLKTTQVARTAECSASSQCTLSCRGEMGEKRGVVCPDHARFEQPTCFSQPRFSWAALAPRPDKGVDEVIASRTADFRSESPNSV